MTTPEASRILVVDDEEEVLASLELVLCGAGYQVGRAGSGLEAIERLNRESYDLVITDLRMPGIHGGDLVGTLVQGWPGTPVVVLTAYGTIGQAVETMRMGAADYLVKPIDPSELLIRIGRRLEDRAVRAERRRLRRLIAEEGYGGIHGRDPKLHAIFDIIERVAHVPCAVLITGEPGTGKELIARAIHDRRNELLRESSEDSFDPERHPFIGVNCGAFARQLLESQLFGHRKGAFTGAIADQEGVFVAADRGTLFLDEITELEIDLQVKLLRAIQELEVTPVGAARPVPVHARIISATNRPVADLVRTGRFRDDLYYRLNVVGIEVPPLRERRGDIPILAEKFVLTISERYGSPPKEIAGEVLDAFQRYPWPGNVRELQNVIERSFVVGRKPGRIGPEDIPEEILRGRAASLVSPSGNGAGTSTSGFPTIDELLAEHVRDALGRANGVRSRAATLLGIDRNRLARLIRKYEIEPQKRRPGRARRPSVPKEAR